MILFDKRIRVVFEGSTTSLYFPTRKHEPYYKIWSNIPNKWWVTKKTGGTLQADGSWAEDKEPYSFDSPILAYRKARGWGLNDESVTDPVMEPAPAVCARAKFPVNTTHITSSKSSSMPPGSGTA